MDPMRRRRRALGPKHEYDPEPLPLGGQAALNEQSRAWAEEQVRKFAEVEGQCPLLLSARTRRVVEHVLNMKQGDQPWGNMIDRVNMADPVAVVVAACILWNRMPPSFVTHFLDQISDAANLTAKALYLRTVRLMQDELGEEAPRGCSFEEDCDSLPPLRLNWSAEERLVLAAPPGSKGEARWHGASSRTDGRQAERHGNLRKGLPRAWFGSDAFHGSEEEDDGEVKRPRRPAKKGDLPILDRKAEIMRLVRQNQVVLLQGETGCGKTTQVPQFILEMAKEAQQQEPDRPVRIVCTQPRRIAAISVAQRVADERGEILGEGAVGYKIRGTSVAGKDCELLFCTTGVLLRRLIYEGRKWMFSPKTVTHLLVDEVHERSADTDFLLTFLRDISATRPNLRVVLMSATLDTKSFLRFFSVSRGGRVIEPPTIHIKGFMYPVAEVYLETVALKCGYHKALEAQSPGVSSTGQKSSDEVDCQLLAQLIDDIFWSKHGPWDFVTDRQVKEENKDKWATAQGGPESKGAILVFLPGVGEINELVSALKMQRSAGKLWVLPLHASLPPDEQQICFETLLPQGYETKVICATNIAETSVTVPDVVVVIDTCRHRLNMMDKGSQVATLKLKWCAQDSLRQRRGRAGRVQPGVAFRLIMQDDMEKLDETTPPEMTRTPLENLYLQSCASGITDVPNFLLRTPDPPAKLAIQSAETCLRDIDALDDSTTDHLTQLGRLLGALPTHPRIGKMLIIGCLLGCPHEILSIGGFLAARSPLVTAPDARRGQWMEAREELMRTVGFVSDHLAWALLLSDWEQLNVGQRRHMGNKYGLVFERMNEAMRERQLLAESLVGIGFLPKDFTREKMDSRARARWPLVVAAIVGGMYPNILYAERVGERSAGNDPGQRALAMRYQVLQRHHSKQEAMSYPKPIHMHQCSICYGADRFNCPFMAYFTSQQTTKLYCYDATEVTPWSVLIMSGEDPVFEQTECTRHVMVGGWTKFECASPSIMQVITALRNAWCRVLDRKVEDPRWDHTESRELVVIKRLLLDQGSGFELAR